MQLNWEEIDSGKEATQGTLNTEQQIVNNRSRRNKNFPSRLSDYQLYPNNAISGDGDLVQQLALMADAEPIDLDEAIVSEVWRSTMEEGLRSIEKNQTWEMVELPQNKTLIGVKWIFKVKLKLDGTVAKYKARLVAKGFMQKK